MRSWVRVTLAAAATMAAALPAQATVYTYTITGTTIAPPSDPLDLYDNPLSIGTIVPDGEAFTLVYQVDDAVPSAAYVYGPAGSSAQGGGIYGGTTPPVTATLAVAGASYTVRQGNSFVSADDPSGDKFGTEVVEQDGGAVRRSGNMLGLSAQYDKTSTSYVSSFAISLTRLHDELFIDLASPDFTSPDYRRNGSFALAPGSVGLFLRADNSFYYTGGDPVDFTAAGLSATRLVVSGGVPEPATWGMMLIGFGLAGAAMRRARQAGGTAAA